VPLRWRFTDQAKGGSASFGSGASNSTLCSRLGASGRDLGGIAWDAPLPCCGRCPKPVGSHGEPGGTRNHGPKIQSAKTRSGDLLYLTILRIASGTLIRTAARCHPPIYSRSPSIAAYTNGGSAGDAGRAAACVTGLTVPSTPAPRLPTTRGRVEDRADTAL
jgi:hypothetical protein